MLGFNVPQCWSLLFILLILDTSAELGIYVFALDNVNKRCFVMGCFSSALTDLEDNNNIMKERKNLRVWYEMYLCGSTRFLSVFHNLLERRKSDPIQKWEEAVLTSAAGAAPQTRIHWSSREMGNGKENHCRALPVRLLWCPHAVGGCLLK